MMAVPFVLYTIPSTVFSIHSKLGALLDSEQALGAEWPGAPLIPHSG